MALEEEVASLTDRLDGVIDSMADQPDSRPDGMFNLAERLEIALSEGFDDLQETLSEMEGGVERTGVEENIGEQVENVLPNESFDTEEVIAQEIAVEQGFEDQIGESAAQAVSENLDVEAVEAFSQIIEDSERLNEVFEELSESSRVSEEQLSALRPTFESLEEEVQSVAEAVQAGETSMSEAREQIINISEQAKQDLSENIEGQFENIEGLGQELQEITTTYLENIQAQAQAQQGGFTGQTFLEVGGAVSEIGGGELSFFQTISDRVRNITSTLTEADAGGLLPSADRIEETDSLMDTIRESASEFSSALSASRVALAGILAPLAMAADLVEDAFGAAREFREETGIGADRMRELRDLTAEVSTELAGFGLEPGATTDIALSLQERFGSIATATEMSGENLQTLVEQSGALSGRLGTSASESTKILGTFIELESLIGGSAQQAAATAINLAEANEVAPQAVIQDITENSEQLAKFSGNTTESLAKAAVEAQRLGTSLGSVAEFQEQALTGITDQVQQLQKASMLTGQQFNTTALIQASYEGTGEALDEITSQLEGVNFENLDFFQRQALEQAFPGFSLQELERLSRGQEILQQTTTTAERAQAIGEGELSFAQAIQADDVDEVERLRRQFNQLYFVLAEELFPVLSDLIDAVLPGLTALLKGATPVIKGFAEGIEIALSPLELLNAAVQSLRGNAEKSEEALESFKSSIGGIIQPFDNLATLFGLGSEKAKELNSAIGVLSESVKAVGAFFGAYLTGSFVASAISSLSSLTAATFSFSGAWATLSTVFASSGVGTIIVGVTAAIAGAVAAFRNWESVVGFVSEAFDTFTSTLIGAQENSSQLSQVINMIGSGLSNLGTILSKTAGLVGFLIEKIVGFLGYLFETESAAKTVGAALAVMSTGFAILFDGIVDGITYIAEIIDLFYDLGEAIVQGRFGDLGEIFLEGLEDVASSFIDLIFPPGIEDVVAEKMRGIATTIIEMLPQSPAEKGPLSNLDQVDISGEITRSIDEKPVEDKVKDVTSKVAEGAKVQANAPEVAAVDAELANAPQQAAATSQPQPQQTDAENQIRLDSSEDDIEGILQQILEMQQQFLQELRNGNIAVYLDGRKVNKELTSSLKVGT